jgi:hypothetical protein
MNSLTTVHLRVNDSATGAATPVRLRVTNAEGEYFAPLGRLTTFATGRGLSVGGNVQIGTKNYALIGGTCEIALPPGNSLVEFSKGPEYRPESVETELLPGKLALRFNIERWIDLRNQGWYSGDTRSHYLSPAAALLEGAAEDLAVVNVLSFDDTITDSFGKKYKTLPNILDFSGQEPALMRPGHLVVFNTHNTHPVLGSLGLLNCHRGVFPLSFGGTDSVDDWTLRDWCGQCHRKGGLVVWTRPWHEWRDLTLGEPLADAILGDIDAFEIDYFEDSPYDVLSDWYDLLNCGCRLSLVGASGKDGNGLALGSTRTYARLQPGEELTYRNWIEAIRAGRTFATNGPLLSFTVNGLDPGSTVDLKEPGEMVRVSAEARSVVPFEHLEIVAGGKVIASVSATGPPCSATLDLELPVSESGWIAARCRGSHLLPHRPAPQRVFAHSSPVLLRVVGQPATVNAEAAGRLSKQLTLLLKWVTNEACCPTDKHRAALTEVFASARQHLQRQLG